MQSDQPLYLPKGSVQAILILTLTGGILIFAARGIEVAKDILIAWSTILGTYFGARGNANTNP